MEEVESSLSLSFSSAGVEPISNLIPILFIRLVVLMIVSKVVVGGLQF